MCVCVSFIFGVEPQKAGGFRELFELKGHGDAKQKTVADKTCKSRYEVFL